MLLSASCLLPSDLLKSLAGVACLEGFQGGFVEGNGGFCLLTARLVQDFAVEGFAFAYVAGANFETSHHQRPQAVARILFSQLLEKFQRLGVLPFVGA